MWQWSEHVPELADFDLAALSTLPILIKARRPAGRSGSTRPDDRTTDGADPGPSTARTVTGRRQKCRRVTAAAAHATQPLSPSGRGSRTCRCRSVVAATGCTTKYGRPILRSVRYVSPQSERTSRLGRRSRPRLVVA